MRILILVAVVCLLGVTEARTKKKSIKDDVQTPEYKGKHKKVPSAIIAIEIVDPNENKTSSRNSKRTIESSLGYGYQQPKYEVYKYSQHDIPPYRGPKNLFSGYSKNSDLLVQKSVSYTLPSQKYTQADNSGSSHYQPGTRLYSTLDQQGHIGQLSSDIPQSPHGPEVPVVILRVFPNQLDDPHGSLHANLPKSHPFAANINSIDIQSLLNNYIQSNQHHVNPYVAAYMNTPALYQQQQGKYQEQNYQQALYPTQEQSSYSGPEQSSYSVQEQPQQTYQDYQAQTYIPQPKQPLLTHENYPSDSHTRVIFKDNKGKIRHSQREKVPTKTINIHVPSNIKDVQVETSEVPYQPPSQNVQQDNQNYYYYQQQQLQGDQNQYLQQQGYQAEQGYPGDLQYQTYQQPQQYSGEPIVVADPQQQQYEQPHQLYGQPQYESAQQQYTAPSDYYPQQPSINYKDQTEGPIVYATPTNYQKRKVRSKKRNATKQPKQQTTAKNE